MNEPLFTILFFSFSFFVIYIVCGFIYSVKQSDRKNSIIFGSIIAIFVLAISFFYIRDWKGKKIRLSGFYIPNDVNPADMMAR